MVAASLLVVPAAPVMGVDGVPDHPARYSACVGTALEPAGFRDMDGSFAEDAANCLAHYAITLGTGPGQFSPEQVVPRRQMALFLVRAAHAAGIEVPEPFDQRFADLDVGAGTRDAISQMTGLGIMEGTSPTTFDPHGPITRDQMAVMLARFLRLARIGPGGTNIHRFEPDDDHFEDLASVSDETRLAIRKLYEMGVTQGTSAFKFSPGREVNRGQMAVFISRTLAHTIARPAGLAIQVAAAETPADPDVSKVEVAISNRSPDHAVRAASGLDVFTSTNPGKAFDESGSCASKEVSPVGRGRACVIDGSDWETDVSGNLLIEVDPGDAGAFRVWVWRGYNGKVYDHGSDMAVAVDVRTLNPVTALRVSDDMRSTARKLRFGDTVTFTFQLLDAEGEPVRKPGVKLSIQVEETRNDRTGGPETISMETGADGSAQHSFRHPDPSTKEDGDIARLDLDLADGEWEVSDRTTLGLVAGDGSSQDTLLTWSDEEKGEPTTITLTVEDEYRVASRAAGPFSEARAVLTDQYGLRVAGESVAFTSSDSSVLPSRGDRTTDVGGAATFRYRRHVDSGVIQWITARLGDVEATARQYWAARIPAGSEGSGEVRVVDTAGNRAVVVSGNDVWLVEYGPGDHFLVDGTPERLLTFEDALEVGGTLTFDIAPSASEADTFTLTNR